MFLFKEFIVIMLKVKGQQWIDWKNGQALLRTQRSMARMEGTA